MNRLDLAVVQNAIRTAARLGLLTVEERRREGQRNRPNIVRIVLPFGLVTSPRAGGLLTDDSQPLSRVRMGGPFAFGHCALSHSPSSVIGACWPINGL